MHHWRPLLNEIITKWLQMLDSTLNLSRQEPEEEDLVPASSDEGIL